MAMDDVSNYERTIVSLMIGGYSDGAIARHVNVARRTLERHIAKLMQRVGAPNRTALGALAAHHGWVDVPALAGPSAPRRPVPVTAQRTGSVPAGRAMAS